MDNIFSILADKKDADSLRNIQSTSSAVYSVVSPYLYRHLTLKTDGLITLLRLFDDVVLDLEVFSLDYATIEPHPIDMHLFHRLLWSLAFVQTILLPECGPRWHSLPETVQCYTDTNAAMTVFRRSLWPTLDSVYIAAPVDDNDIYYDGHEHLPFPHHLDVYIPVYASLRPRHLHIDLPSVVICKNEAALAVWGARPPSSLRNLEADHVTIMNLAYDRQGIPHARKSLTIGYGEYDSAANWDSNLSLRCCILIEAVEASWAGLQQVTLVGFERGLNPASHQLIHAELLESMRHSEAAQSASFRYRIKPWGSRDTGAWDVWHRIDEPYGDQ